MIRHTKYFLVILTISSAITILPIQAQEAPNVPLYDLTGGRHILFSIIDSLPEGGIAILNFTSIYCKPCKKEIPELLAIAGSSRKIKLLCIYAENAKLSSQSAGELGVYDRAYVDPLGAVQQKFGVKKYPVTVLINKKKQIVGRYEGYSEKNIEAIKRAVLP